jgi:hypothetical protein
MRLLDDTLKGIQKEQEAGSTATRVHSLASLMYPRVSPHTLFSIQASSAPARSKARSQPATNLPAVLILSGTHHHPVPHLSAHTSTNPCLYQQQCKPDDQRLHLLRLQ